MILVLLFYQNQAMLSLVKKNISCTECNYRALRESEQLGLI